MLECSMKHNPFDCNEYDGLHELSEVEIAIAQVIVPLQIVYKILQATKQLICNLYVMIGLHNGCDWIDQCLHVLSPCWITLQHSNLHTLENMTS